MHMIIFTTLHTTLFLQFIYLHQISQSSLIKHTILQQNVNGVGYNGTCLVQNIYICNQCSANCIWLEKLLDSMVAYLRKSSICFSKHVLLISCLSLDLTFVYIYISKYIDNSNHSYSCSFVFSFPSVIISYNIGTFCILILLSW